MPFSVPDVDNFAALSLSLLMMLYWRIPFLLRGSVEIL
jgi:hypothetical protein